MVVDTDLNFQFLNNGSKHLKTVRAVAQSEERILKMWLMSISLCLIYFMSQQYGFIILDIKTSQLIANKNLNQVK